MIFFIIAIGFVVYLNGFFGAFLFDDRDRIFESAHLPRPEKLGDILIAPRPFLHLSFAINYVLGGFDVWGYHAVNLAIHILAALTLFGIVGRTLLTERLQPRYGKAAIWLAFGVAVIWMIHPLQTQSVTYIIQRAEALMGLFYLLTLYSVIRGVESPHPNRWYVVAILFCELGMATKEVMVTAPLLILLYDRIFLASSFKEILQKRKFLYLGLFATWIIVWNGSSWILNPSPNPLNPSSVGFGLRNVSPLEYARTQPGVILHYLRLSFYPHPLVIDYAWPVAKTFEAIFFPSLVIGALFLLTVWAFRTRAPLGFLGAWFFLILAPTSSFIPIADLAVEHRMYLPLAAVVAFAIMGGYEALNVLQRRRVITAYHKSFLGFSLVAALVAVLGTLTIQRNNDYESEETIWGDTLRKRPQNYRAHYNLAAVLFAQGKFDEAIAHLMKALEINPLSAAAHKGLGLALVKQKNFDQENFDQAKNHDKEALRIQPAFAQARNHLGNALAGEGKFDEAIGHFSRAVQSNPDDAEAHNNLGQALLIQGKLDEAIAHLMKALEINPLFAAAHNGLGIALTEQKKFDQANTHFKKALRIQPAFAQARNNLERALVLARQEKMAEAIRIDRGSSEAHYRLGQVLADQGKFEEALVHYADAIRLKPDDVEAQVDFGIALMKQGKFKEAVDHYSEALRLAPEHARAHCHLGNALAGEGKFDEAIGHFSHAVQSNPDYAEAHYSLGQTLLIQGKFDEASAHFSKVLELVPDNEAAARDLLVARFRQQALEERSESGGPSES